MPGFGSGSFGNSPFGQWNWSAAVLWDLLPSYYKQQDPDAGGHLASFMEALRWPFENLRNDIEHFGDMREPFEVRSQYDEVKTLRLGPVIVPVGTLEQRGIDGIATPVGEFVSPSARFRPEDIGKTITVTNSPIKENNRTFVISKVLSNTNVVTVPLLIADPTLIRWELRDKVVIPTDRITVEVRSGDVSEITAGWVLWDGFGQFQVLDRRQFVVRPDKSLLTDKEGQDGGVDANGQFTSAVAQFSPVDVGKKLTIAGSEIPENNGKFEIMDLVDATTVTFSLLRVQSATTDGQVLYSLKNAVSGVQIWHKKEGLLTVFSLDVNKDAKTVVVNLATDAFGVITTTADEIAAAVNADALASQLVRARSTGAGLAGSTDSFVEVLGVTLAPDVGPLTWAILPFAQLDVELILPPKGTSEQWGGNLQVVPPSTVRSETANFTTADIGKLLTIRGSQVAPTNSGTFVITAVAGNMVEATVDQVFAVGEIDLPWDLRKITGLGDVVDVQVNSSSLLALLAKDFGTEVDLRESEDRQRSWVKNISQWLAMKGSKNGYKNVGLLSGFNVEASKLYRIQLSMYNMFLPSQVIQIGDTGVGRSGKDGKLTLGPGGRVRLTAASALFKSSDVGNDIRISDSLLGNNKLYEIDVFISATEVEFREILDTAVTPDYGPSADPNSPNLKWYIERMYAFLPPMLPNFDEFDPDIMEEVIDGYPLFPPFPNHFNIDKYCWETDTVNVPPLFDWVSWFDVVVTNVVNVGGYVFEVTVQGPADAMVATGPWSLIYTSPDAEFVIETMPVEIAVNTFTFKVISALPPALGAARMRYFCTEQTQCSYCASYRIYLLVTVSPQLASESGVAVEKLFERLLTRLEDAKPAHVELIVVFRQELVATLNLQAFLVDPGKLVGPQLSAFLSEDFDHILTADELPPDIDHPLGIPLSASIKILATVEVP